MQRCVLLSRPEHRRSRHWHVNIDLDAVYISFYILAVWDWQKEKTGIFCRHGTGDLVLFGILIESNLSTGVGGYGFDGAKQCKVCDPTAFLFTGKVYRVGRDGNGDLHVFLLAGRKRDPILEIRTLQNIQRTVGIGLQSKSKINSLVKS